MEERRKRATNIMVCQADLEVARRVRRESEDALISLLLRHPKRAVERASQAGAEKREEHHLAAQEGVAVLTSRLAEATAALADCPIREAPPYVAMIKDIGLAIAALKALQ